MLFFAIFSYLRLLMCSSGFGSWEHFPAWPCWPLETKTRSQEGIWLSAEKWRVLGSV